MPRSLFLLLTLALLAAGPIAQADSFEEAREAYDAGDYTTAFEQFLEAARSGDRNAFGQVGALYLYGRGTAVDYQQAYAWFEVAARHGDQYGVRFRDTAAAQLTAAELEAAHALAEEYDKRYASAAGNAAESGQ